MEEKNEAHAVEPGKTNSNGELHELHFDACIKAGRKLPIREVVSRLQPGKRAREKAIAKDRDAKVRAAEDYC